jgi:hypothetical protein
MNDKTIKKLVTWSQNTMGIVFFTVKEDNGIVNLVSKDTILKGVNTNTVTIHLNSELFPDDVAMITLNIIDKIIELGYKKLLVGDIFTFDTDKLFYGKEAIERFEQRHYDFVREKVMHDILLDYKLRQVNAFNC